MLGPGPFKPEHLPSKSSYELDQGHPVLCLPTKSKGGRAQLNGGLMIRTVPGVDAGVEVGFDLGSDTLRAPDVAILAPGEGDDWAKQAPPLAIEYADAGQNEKELARKTAQLLAAGTRAVWVVRLVGPNRVEVHTSDADAPRILGAGDDLTLEGVLPRPIPVAAFFDSALAEQVAFRNLLDGFGFKHPEAAFEEGLQEGRQEGRQEGLRAAAVLLLRARGERDPDRIAAALDERELLALFAKG